MVAQRDDQDTTAIAPTAGRAMTAHFIGAALEYLRRPAIENRAEEASSRPASSGKRLPCFPGPPPEAGFVAG
jgi:hypothetical protein